MINPETRAILQQYVGGNVSNADLAEWLVQTEYDSSVPQDERDSMGQLRLVVIEEAEGSRDKDEVLTAVAEILAREAPQQTLFTFRTESTTKWPQPTTPLATTGVASPAQHAGI